MFGDDRNNTVTLFPATGCTQIQSCESQNLLATGKPIGITDGRQGHGRNNRAETGDCQQAMVGWESLAHLFESDFQLMLDLPGLSELIDQHAPLPGSRGRQITTNGVLTCLPDRTQFLFLNQVTLLHVLLLPECFERHLGNLCRGKILRDDIEYQTILTALRHLLVQLRKVLG